MQEIQGKIKFIALRVIGNINIDQDCFMSLSDEQTVDIVLLSDITEEQAAEFVDCVCHSNGKILGYKDYFINPVQLFQTAKESLVSLLKANDVWIKEWKEKPTGRFVDPNNDVVDWNVGRAKIEYNKLPDDLLLIKL